MPKPTSPVDHMMASHQPPTEVTKLNPHDELYFQMWARANGLKDLDHPDSHYDYRGFWKQYGPVPRTFGVDHFPDTYKQHGHPTFSTESKYSSGPSDGGMWLGDTFLPQPEMATGHPVQDPLMQTLLSRVGGQ